ncbi:MAG TPA: WbqC family protein [Azonexus sp.]
MIVATHQPHYLPWLGYLDRMQKADLFVVLDHVQFERRNYQNRTRILLDGLPRWLTVPVVQASQLERVLDKRIDNPAGDDKKSWGLKHYQTLRHAYRDAPFFDVYGPELYAILTSCPGRLVDIDQMTLDFLRQALGIHTPLVNSSDLDLRGARSELILNLCLAVGADTYLAGMGGSRTYLDQAKFAEAGVRIAWQEFQHPVYSQCGGAAFVPGLSAVDLLFNHGPQSREILHRRSHPRRIAEPA